RLVVRCTAGVDVAAFVRRAERIKRPLVSLRGDDVGVAHYQDRALAAVALDPRDQVGARRLERELLTGDAFLFENLLQERGGFGFVARRIAGVDAQHILEMLHDFGCDSSPIDGVAVLRLGGGDGRENEEQSGRAGRYLHVNPLWQNFVYTDECSRPRPPGSRSTGRAAPRRSKILTLWCACTGLGSFVSRWPLCAIVMRRRAWRRTASGRRGRAASDFAASA